MGATPGNPQLRWPSSSRIEDQRRSEVTLCHRFVHRQWQRYWHENTIHLWKKKYDQLGTAEIREINELRDENTRLKRLVADLTLDQVMLQDVLSKKL